MSDNIQKKIVDPIIYIWLDDTIETSKASRDTKTRLQQLVEGRLLTFTNPDECIDYITTEILTQKIYFIVSNKLGKDVVPLIYDIPEIETVYVYCTNRPVAESWAKSNLKVRGIFTQQVLLTTQICKDIHDCAEKDHLPMTAFDIEEKGRSVEKLSPENTTFMWYQVVMNVLLLMAKYFNSKEEMTGEARVYYHNDKLERKRIDEFEQKYESEQAFWWYTSNGFVYRVLNNALRRRNIEVIFKFRFFINDLHHQIQRLYQQYLENHAGNNLRVYRGQFMSTDEVEFLKKNVDGIISTNSFLSTSQRRDVAEMFLNSNGPSNDPSSEQSVLFIIDICDINQDTTAFGFIKRYACNPDEEEVLFTINAIFKVESVKQETNIWHVYLKLSRQQNQYQTDFSAHMMQAMGSNPGPSSFGWFLYRMGDFKAAERYCEYIRKQLFLEEKERGNACNLLGLIYGHLKGYKRAIEYFKEALDFYVRSDSSADTQVITIHHSLSLTYLADGDNRYAEDHRREADELLANSPAANNPLLKAMKNVRQGKMDAAHGDLVKGLQSLENAFKEKQKVLPPDHPAFVSSLNEIGAMQEKIGEYDKAMICFKRALEICKKCLTENHLDLADCYTNIGLIHYKHKEYELALEQYERALKIITDATGGENERVVKLLQCISEINDTLCPRPPD